MEEKALDGMMQTQEYPLAVLEHVPISKPYIAAMTSMLTEHGARLTETKNVPDSDATRAYKEFTITFPPGTRQSFGLRMLRSRYFLILFPDGFQVRGGELWPLAFKDGDTATTVLHLPA